jgi:hypothetical protein
MHGMLERSDTAVLKLSEVIFKFVHFYGSLNIKLAVGSARWHAPHFMNYYAVHRRSISVLHTLSQAQGISLACV